MGFRRHVWVFGLVLSMVSCGDSGVAPTPAKVVDPDRPIGTPISIAVPLGLLPVPIPRANPPTEETVALGEKLYFSPLLSVDRTLSCASCHDPKFGFADGKPVSTGVAGKKGKRNAPTVLNAVYNTSQFWDGRAATLEAQASGPMLNMVEMAHTLEGVIERCQDDPELRGMAAKAFGPGPVTIERVTRAIASYERTLVSGNSPFDRFFYGKDRTALSAAAKRGFAVFRDPKKGNCATCHVVKETHALFADQNFHNLGVGMNAKGELTDPGRYIQTLQESDQGAFRTPSLRNVALTAPYMHDGSLKTLKEVVDFYVSGGNSNDHLDKDIRKLELTRQEREDLVAFLESLTGDMPATAEGKR
jgi:cytochrome c peroxidase